MPHGGTIDGYAPGSYRFKGHSTQPHIRVRHDPLSLMPKSLTLARSMPHGGTIHGYAPGAYQKGIGPRDTARGHTHTKKIFPCSDHTLAAAVMVSKDNNKNKMGETRVCLARPNVRGKTIVQYPTPLLTHAPHGMQYPTAARQLCSRSKRPGSLRVAGNKLSESDKCSIIRIAR